METIQIIGQVVEAIAYIVAGATIIARLTPTKKDDEILEKIRKYVEKASNLFIPDRKSK
jgi:SepF-like predicted cell division protein (DUF552 family)